MKLDDMLATKPSLPKYDGKPDDCLYCMNTTTHASRICMRCRNDFADDVGENIEY